MKRYRVLKPRFVYQGREYRAGDRFEAKPSSLLRRAERDGDLIEDATEAAAPAPKRKPKRSDA